MNAGGVAVQEAICWKLDPTKIGLLLVIVPIGAKNVLVFA